MIAASIRSGLQWQVALISSMTSRPNMSTFLRQQPSLQNSGEGTELLSIYRMAAKTSERLQILTTPHDSFHILEGTRRASSNLSVAHHIQYTGNDTVGMTNPAIRNCNTRIHPFRPDVLFLLFVSASCRGRHHILQRCSIAPLHSRILVIASKFALPLPAIKPWLPLQSFFIAVCGTPELL